jgi:hypothetical protein
LSEWIVESRFKSDDPWQKLANESGFLNEIEKEGCYQSPIPFELFKRKYGLQLRLKTPSYLSIDFWSKQSKTLTERGLYVMRTGRGNFVILDDRRFPKPYLQLTTEVLQNWM